MAKQIISVSRRTDIPAFYSEWFMNRVRAGFVQVPNPYNAKQESCVSLKPADVSAIVFWTRNPRPLMPYLDELDALGFKYYFNYTLMDNPRAIDPKSPPMESGIKTFHALASRVGANRVVWRYDPIVLSNKTDVDFHLEKYAYIADALHGHTERSVISIVDVYRKITERMRALESQGISVAPPDVNSEDFARLMHGLKAAADKHGYHIQSCAEDIDLTPYGVLPGKCIDDELIKSALGVDVKSGKDKAQREACGCVVSRELGMYDSCNFGCAYCYATTSFEKAAENYKNHDPKSPTLIGWPKTECPDASKADTPNDTLQQLDLFTLADE